MFHTVFLAFLVVFSLSSIGSSFEIAPRIVNGTISKRGQFLFFALLFVHRRYEPKDTYTCGATLLNNEFVVTAAHCLDNATKAQVHLGSFKQYKYEKGRHMFFARRKHFYIHPEYDHENLYNDIALIKLPRPAVFSKLIQPVLFPTVCEIPSDLELIAIGNGYNETDGELANTLKYTTITTVPHSECVAKYLLADDNPSFCARSDNSAICQGDSGGPVINAENNEFYGLTSFTGDNCDEMPQGFTDFIAFLPWVSKITGISFINCD